MDESPPPEIRSIPENYVLVEEIKRLRGEVKEKDLEIEELYGVLEIAKLQASERIDFLETDVSSIREKIDEQSETLHQLIKELKIPSTGMKNLSIQSPSPPTLAKDNNSTSDSLGLLWNELPLRLSAHEETPIARIWDEISSQMRLLDSAIQKEVNGKKPADGLSQMISNEIRITRNSLIVAITDRVLENYTEELKKANQVQEEVRTVQQDVIRRLELLNKLARIEIKCSTVSKKSNNQRKRFERLVKDFQKWLEEIEQVFDLKDLSEETEEVKGKFQLELGEMKKLKADVEYWKRRLERSL